MTFHVEELCIKLSEALYPLMGRIKARDKALEDQLRRSAVSIGLMAWRLGSPADAESAMTLVNRIVAILWRMTRG